MAAQLKDGASVFVEIGTNGDVWTIRISEMDAAYKVALGRCIDVNRASQKDLRLIRGVGEKTATAIVEYRRKYGAFETIDELMQIKGIKEKRLAKLRHYLCVH